VGSDLPTNFPRVLADLAFHFKWTPQVLDGLTVDEALQWHSMLCQVLKKEE
jgi:hypothetical protein